MSEPATPVWPEAGAFPFMPFPLPGSNAASAAPGSAAQAAMQQGLSGGIDLIRDFWSRMPGSAAVPGFLLPTVDVDELDKRIGDLKAAERWVEVNLGLLRATIQGLEVQRHTIAALQSLTTPSDAGTARAARAAEQPPSSGLPPGWPSPPTAAREPSAPAESAAPAADAAPAAPAANEWLAYLQAQFSKVAQAAMVPAAATPAAKDAPRRKVSKKVASRAPKTTAAR